MRTQVRDTPVVVRFESDAVDLIDMSARKKRLNRSEYIRSVVHSAIEAERVLTLGPSALELREKAGH